MLRLVGVFCWQLMGLTASLNISGYTVCACTLAWQRGRTGRKIKKKGKRKRRRGDDVWREGGRRAAERGGRGILPVSVYRNLAL